MFTERASSEDPNYHLRGTISCSSKVAAVVPTRCFLAAEGGMINDMAGGHRE